MDLSGKVAVVTGAGRGLGRAYATALGAAGAAVVVNDVDADVANETAKIITDAGGKATIDTSPIGTAEAADSVVQTAVKEFGKLDIMVTNAGVLRDKTLVKTTDEDFDKVVETHLRGTFTCGRAAVTQFREQGEGGRLILIGSPAGQRASFGQTAYSASKAGIIGMVRTWAVECERAKIMVNGVVPVALTRMVATIPGLGDIYQKVEQGEAVPAKLREGGLGTADDVAGLVVFLASDAVEGVTGQVFGAGGDKLTLWSHPSEVVEESKEGGWSADDIAGVFQKSFSGNLQDYKQAPPPMPED